MNEIVKEGIKETIKQSFDKASKFLGKIVNPPLEELGLLAKDTVKYWRFKNQVNILLKAEKFLEDKNIAPKKIPLKTIVPLLENGSLEEDDFMQTKWAALLANTIDSTYQFDIHYSYVEILKQLSPFEAQLLDKIYIEAKSNPENDKTKISFSKEKILELTNISSDRFNILVDNLFRLNLLQPPASHGGVSIGKYPVSLRTYETIQITSLGYDFIKACRRE